MTATALREIKAPKLGQRINAHLKRQEQSLADHAGVVYERTED
jgi:hypothetical protein